MLQILFACARTGQFVPTGIETDLDTLRCTEIWQPTDVMGH